MASSRRTHRRRQQKSIQRHQLRLEGLEKRYALNAAPVLDPAASPQLNSVIKDTGAPVGQVGTLVSDLIDTGGTHNNFSDADGDLPGIAITQTNPQDGVIYYSIDDGDTWTALGAASGNSARLLYADSTTRLAYSPKDGFSGSISNVLRFRAWDRSGDYFNSATGVATKLPLIGEFNPLSDSTVVVISPDGNTAYVGSNSGLQIIDVSNPAFPLLIGTYDDAPSITGITISSNGDIAYITTAADGLKIIDVSNPALPALDGEYKTLGLSDGITLSPNGSIAYVAGLSEGLKIIDVSNPTSPALVSIYDTPGDTRSVAISSDGNTAYVADKNAGFQIIDVTNLMHPTLLGQHRGAWAYDVTLSLDGSIAYVADSGGGLKVFNVSNPVDSKLIAGIGGISHPNTPDLNLIRRIALSQDGNTIYGTRPNKLNIIDVSDPENPKVVFEEYCRTSSLSRVTLSPDGNSAYHISGDGAINDGQYVGSIGLRIINLAQGSSVEGFSIDYDWIGVQVDVPEVISSQGSNILAKDSNQNLYVNTQPVIYQGQQVPQAFFGSYVIGADTSDSENALMLKPLGAGAEDPPTHRLLTDETWRINGIFNSLQNASSPVLDLSGREVSGTLNIAAVAGAYEINGVKNPTLIVRRGQTYTFNLNTAGHPFYLQTTGGGYQSSNVYNDGFTGNSQTIGEHQWVVPEDAPDEIFYQCEFHPVMFGKIIVVD